MKKVSDDFVVIGNTGGYYDENGKFIVCEEYETFSDDDSDPCVSCESSDCSECEFASFENMMAHLFNGELDDFISVGDFGDDD